MNGTAQETPTFPKLIGSMVIGYEQMGVWKMEVRSQGPQVPMAMRHERRVARLIREHLQPLILWTWRQSRLIFQGPFKFKFKIKIRHFPRTRNQDLMVLLTIHQSSHQLEFQPKMKRWVIWAQRLFLTNESGNCWIQLKMKNCCFRKWSLWWVFYCGPY